MRTWGGLSLPANHLYSMPKKSSRKFVGKLTIGFMFLYQVQKLRKVIAVQLLHIYS
jgi:hypothetical protein